MNLMFVLCFYWLPLVVDVTLLVGFWEAIKREFEITRVKHLIVAVLVCIVVSAIPLVNWLLTLAGIHLAVRQVFDNNDERHWWNKKI